MNETAQYRSFIEKVASSAQRAFIDVRRNIIDNKLTGKQKASMNTLPHDNITKELINRLRKYPNDCCMDSAYVRQLSAGEFYAAKAVQQAEEMFFTINWRNDLNLVTMCFIRYNEKLNNITRVDTFEGYKKDLKLYAALLASQPKPGEFVEWEAIKK